MPEINERLPSAKTTSIGTIAKTLPVISSPLAADARDDDFDMWLAFMPWTVGLWLVTGVLIFRGVRRNRTVDRVKP